MKESDPKSEHKAAWSTAVGLTLFALALLASAGALVMLLWPVSKDTLVEVCVPRPYEYGKDRGWTGDAPSFQLGYRGLINANGRIVLDADYDWISKPDKMGSISALKGDEVYFLDKDHHLLFTRPAAELERNFFREGFDQFGMRLWYEGGNYGWLGMDGSSVIPFHFDSVSDGFDHTDYAIVEKDGMWGTIDRSGNVICPLEWDYISPDYTLSADGSRMVPVPISASGLSVLRGKKWGRVNLSGKVQIPPQWDDIGAFGDQGLAIVQKDNKYGWLDRSGKVVIPVEWQAAFDFDSSDLAMVGKNGKFGWIDITGSFVIAPQWDEAWPFDDHGLAAVAISNPDHPDTLQYGWINVEGDTVIEPRWDDVGCNELRVQLHHLRYRFDEEGMVIVKKSGLYGWLNSDGTVALPPKWKAVTAFDDRGMALVKEGKDYAYINRKGERIFSLPDHFTYAGFDKADRLPLLEPFEPGYGFGESAEVFGWYDRNGTLFTPEMLGRWRFLNGKYRARHFRHDPPGFYTLITTAPPGWYAAATIALDNWFREDGTPPKPVPKQMTICHCYDLSGNLIWSSTWMPFNAKCITVIVAGLLLALIFRPKRGKKS